MQLPLRDIVGIINSCDLEDAELFKKRYAELIIKTRNLLEKRKYAVLKARAQRRIRELHEKS